MSFTVRATDSPSRVRVITCDGCGESERVLDDRSRDQWKRGHVCVPAGRPLDDTTAMLPRGGSR